MRDPGHEAGGERSGGRGSLAAETTAGRPRAGPGEEPTGGRSGARDRTLGRGEVAWYSTRPATHRSGEPRPTGSASYRPAPEPSRAPGLSEAMPLLFVGGAALVIGLFLGITRSSDTIGRIPLILPALAIGAVLCIGGSLVAVLPADAVPDPDHRPPEGAPADPSRADWEEVRALILALREMTSPKDALRRPASAPEPSGVTFTEPWDESVEADRDARSASPAKLDTESGAMLQRIDEAERDLESRAGGLPRIDRLGGRPVPEARPARQDPSADGPRRTDRTWASGISRTVPRSDEGVFDPEISSVPSASRRPRDPAEGPREGGAVRGKCVSCGRLLEPASVSTDCVSCGRTICDPCSRANIRRWHLPLCVDCARFVDARVQPHPSN